MNVAQVMVLLLMTKTFSSNNMKVRTYMSSQDNLRMIIVIKEVKNKITMLIDNNQEISKI